METDAASGQIPGMQAGRFLNDPGVSSKRVGPARSDGAALYVWRDALDALLESVRLTSEPYHAALLLGVAGQTPAGLVTEVRAWADFEAIADAETWTQEMLRTWDVSANRIVRAHPGLVPCGWVSIRRGGGATLTPADAIAHRTFFGMPWQVTLLLDPQGEALSFWGPAPSGELVNIGFTVLSRRAAAQE